MRCLSCGQDNPPEAGFCGNCGAALVSPVEPPPPAVAHIPRGVPRKWLFIGGLAILIMVGLGYGVTSLLKAPPPPPPPAATEGSSVGDLAPDFQLQDLGGQVVSLSTLRGVPVMLNFWASWCGPCRAEMPYIQQVHEEWSDKGLVVLSINTDEGSSEVRQFMQSNDYSFPVLLDTKKDIARKYNIQGIPTTFFIDKDGMIQEWKLGAFQSKEEIEDCLSKVMPTTVTLPPTGPATVTFADGNLEAAVRDALGKVPGEEITADDLAKLTELEADESGITDLSGLEHCANLIELRFERNEIRDISPLASLINLTEAYLEENEISDISPLENLTSLTELELHENQISDISPLENLTSLTELGLNDNEVRDISPLASLTNLTGLDLENNEIRDISSLAKLTSLTWLGLHENQISDISPLENLTSLTELELHENQISDISPLENLTSLTELGLNRNQISDISPLASLTNLTVLRLNNNEISDISALVENSGLGEGDKLWLEDNELDLTEGSEDMENIRALEDRGVIVHYE